MEGFSLMTRTRAVLYLADTESREQLDLLLRYCAVRGYEVVGAAVRGVRGLMGALKMVQTGEADTVVVASREALPVRLEIATVELVMQPPPDPPSRPGRTRRVR